MPFSCSVPGCSYTAQKPSALSNHVVRMHPETRVACRSIDCTDTFASENLERAHYYPVHGGNKCDLDGCPQPEGYVFSSWKKLKNHMRLQHAEGPPQYSCTLLNDFDETCGTAFQSESQLEQHKTRCHGPKLFDCPYNLCTHATRYAANMTIHINARHTRADQFWCPDDSCDYVSASRSTIARHFKRWHVDGLHRKRGEKEREVRETLIAAGLTLLPSYQVDFNGDHTAKKRALIDFVFVKDLCVFFIEVDEWQHTAGYTADDEIMRMLDVTTEIHLRSERNDDDDDGDDNDVTEQVPTNGNDYRNIVSIAHKHIVWIRFNPSPFPFRVDGQPCQLAREARETALVNFLHSFVPQKTDKMMIMVYMYYDCVTDETGRRIPNAITKSAYAAKMQPHILDSVVLGVAADGSEIVPTNSHKRSNSEGKREANKQSRTGDAHVYPCRFGCPKRVYQTESGRTDHEKKKHVDEYASMKQREDEERGDMTKTYCNECEADFGDAWTYRRHCKDAHTDHQIVCGECEQLFDSVGKLQAHVNKEHRNKKREKKHQCDQGDCRETYWNKSDLAYHMAQTHHIGQCTQYTCVYCVDSNKTYRTITNLNKHLRKAHKDANMFTKATYTGTDMSTGTATDANAATIAITK